MRFIAEIADAAAAWVVIFAVERAGERVLFANAKPLRPLTLPEGAIISGVALVVLLLVAHLRRISLEIAPRLLFVVTIVCVSQWLWLYGISPWWLADEARIAFAARHPFVMLAIEVGLPALAGGLSWNALMHDLTSKRRFLVIATSLIACAATVLVMNPEVIRGTFELAGWIRLASPRHLSGVHSSPLPRNFAYVLVVAVTGLIFYLTVPARGGRSST